MDHKEMFRQVILDHTNNPMNKVDSPIEGYLKRESLNPSCGDEVTVYLKVEADKLVDIKFSGEGCTICCASCDIMSNELKNLKTSAALDKITMFEDIIKNGSEENLDYFEDAQVLVGIKNFPARYKCAHLGWNTVSKMIKEIK